MVLERAISMNTIDALLHKIQFAAANRLCIDLLYNNKHRIVEPLCFITSNNGNRLFYGFEQETEQLKAFSIVNIQNISMRHESYIEKYPVEMTSSGTINMPPIQKK